MQKESFFPISVQHLHLPYPPPAPKMMSLCRVKLEQRIEYPMWPLEQNFGNSLPLSRFAVYP